MRSAVARRHCAGAVDFQGGVAKYVKATEASERSWPELSAADEVELAQLPGAKRRPRGASVAYVAPALASIHQELKRKNVTLALLWEEYVKAANGPAYQYSRFCDLYRSFAKTLKPSMWSGAAARTPELCIGRP